MAPSHRPFVWGECYHQRKLTQGDSTWVSEKARLSVGSPWNPSPPCQGCLMGWASSLPATQQRWCQAQDRPLWESAHQSQALGIPRASGRLGCSLRLLRHPGNQTSGSVTLTERGNISPKKHSAISTVPGSLSCAGLTWTPVLLSCVPQC